MPTEGQNNGSISSDSDFFKDELNELKEDWIVPMNLFTTPWSR